MVADTMGTFFELSFPNFENSNPKRGTDLLLEFYRTFLSKYLNSISWPSPFQVVFGGAHIHLGGPVDAALADAVVAASNLLQDLVFLTQVTHLAFQHLYK